METNQNQAAQSQTTEATKTEVTSTPAVQQSAAPETPAASAATAETTPPPAYNPNYKFKVMDKEQEFDEFIRPVIKDADTEKKIREMYERAHGIDFVKQQRDKYRDEYKTYKTEWEPVRNDLKKLATYIQNGDMENVIKTLGLSDEKLFKYVEDRLQYQQLPYEQRQKIDAQRAEKERLYQLQQENEILRQQYENTAVGSLQYQFDKTMSMPEVKTAAEMFDARVGQPGAFANEVISRGDYVYRATGKMISPEQAAQEVIRLAGLNAQPQNQMSQPSAPPVEAPKVVVPPPTKPTITNIGSKATSPVKKQPRSLDDLKQMYKNMSGA